MNYVVKISSLLLIFIGLFFVSTRAELYTAISDVEPLLDTHLRIIEELEEYIEKEEKRIDVLKSHLKVYQIEHEKAMEDIPNYLGNPINAFTLIKRLTTDLDFIEKKIEIGSEYVKNTSLISDNEFTPYPSLEDLTGAAQALTRLQETYHLDVNDLAEGILNGVIYRDESTPVFNNQSIAIFTSMKSDDCYELGRVLYNEKDYKNALAWMKLALEKYPEDDELYNFTDVDILEYISFCYYLLGDIRNALNWTSKLLKLDPSHERAKGNIPHYQDALFKRQSDHTTKLRGDTGQPTVETKEEDEKPKEPTKYEKERKVYESLCRGEMEIPRAISKRLTCRYLTENHPFLRLAPIKMEYVYLDPDIVVFHEVLNEDEIYEIMMMARPRFRRATVHDPKTGELVPAHYRISKSAWLKDEEAPVVENLSRRIADFTGLSMTSAEELQVVNYGIGGHYEPHFDFARKQESAFENFSGNRIATVLFYMSDVAQGGATVFTELGLSVFPQRGAAVFWLNLHPSGEGDLATRHAACPVLRGSKWVCNKWIHQGGQELIKPCDLEYQSEGIIRPLPRPLVKKTFR
ncbi:prolyl 4-hydroxylase subunit alpha-1 isoform X2 [Nymphalis io]|uniref:prolyl 4-hydroxylase subunit alpha-1 isoform X2 n=1 Tax=Inachis io TaxID=171585 RepID=UPI002168EBB9|nr:prolyl 4-hydroxylase subunit alpha-1 isoform X2 [Nymphalis io]